MPVGRAEKLNVVSNDHGHMQKYDFTVLDRKYPFDTNLLLKKSKLSA